MSISQELLEILACPRCRGSVRLVDDGSGIFCTECSLKYPIRDGIPILLVDEAETVALPDAKDRC